MKATQNRRGVRYADHLVISRGHRQSVRTADPTDLTRGTVFYLFLACITCSSSYGAPPKDPLPPPYYSFDLASPQVIPNAHGIVDANAILEVVNSTPQMVVLGAELGLAPGDELDTLSMNAAIPQDDDPIVLLFSVDRATVGVADPDPALIALRVPYNVKDQAGRGQAAGDQFMSTSRFTLGGGLFNGGRVPALNSVLTRNNWDEGGTDVGGEPPTSAADNGGGAPQDDVDAMSEPPLVRVEGQVLNVYFGVSRRTRSVSGVPGGPGGADIYYNANPSMDPPNETTLYAGAADLGLQADDDINAMIVFDTGVVGVYDALDRIVFSLAPGSPSLTNADSGVVGSAADVFIVSPDSFPEVRPLARAAEFGLGEVLDNINALSFLRCADAGDCAARHGIRAPGVPTASAWGLAVLALLMLAGGTVLIRRRSQDLAGI